jgi:hypothetical protein
MTKKLWIIVLCALFVLFSTVAMAAEKTAQSPIASKISQMPLTVKADMLGREMSAKIAPTAQNVVKIEVWLGNMPKDPAGGTVPIYYEYKPEGADTLMYRMRVAPLLITSNIAILEKAQKMRERSNSVLSGRWMKQ